MTTARLVTFLLGSLIVTSAAAQTQPPDAAFMQRAVSALQAQRNAAQDAAAVAEARAAGLADDLVKARARIKELEPSPAEKPKE